MAISAGNINIFLEIYYTRYLNSIKCILVTVKMIQVNIIYKGTIYVRVIVVDQIRKTI